MSRRTSQADVSAGYASVNVAELTEPASSTNYLLIDPLAPRLPLEVMHWEDFEKLCAQLITTTDHDVQQAFRYGSPQQDQGGIDVLAIRHSTHKKLVMECKRVKQVSRGDISRVFRPESQPSEHFSLNIAYANDKLLYEFITSLPA